MHFTYNVIHSLQVEHFTSASLMCIKDRIMILDNTLAETHE